jgi:hypothetical protein
MKLKYSLIMISPTPYSTVLNNEMILRKDADISVG